MSFLALVVMASVLLVAPSQAASPATSRIGPEFFGIDISIPTQGPVNWPAFEPAGIRVATNWGSIERTAGVYDWTSLDAKVATAEAHGAKPLLVMEGTPKIHARDAVPTYGSPPDLSAYRAFVRALATRYGDRVDYQVWNEANVPVFFTGTPAQMAAMTKAAGKTVRKVAPAATVVSPSFLLRGDTDVVRVWFKNYWAQRINGRRVGKFVDVAAVSAYPMPDEDPEDSIELMEFGRRVLDKRGFDGPMWAVEINYGASGLDPTVAPISRKKQASYLVRTFALQASAGTERVYWWRWELHQTVNTTLQDGQGVLTPAGIAYGVAQDWLVGTRPKGCTTTKGVTTCVFKVNKKVERHISWTRSGKNRTMRVPGRAVTRTKPNGVTKKVKAGRTMKVGVTPVMIEVRRSR